MKPIGHVVVACPRCGNPARVEVLAEIRSIQAKGWHRLRVYAPDGSDCGTSFVRFQAGEREHDCPRPGGREPLRRVA